MLDAVQSGAAKKGLPRSVILAGFFAAYMLSAEVGHLLSFHTPSSEFATYWPPSGLYLAVLLRPLNLPRWRLVAAACCANLASDVVLHGQSWLTSLGFCLANTIEALVGMWAIRKWQLLQGPAMSLRDVLGFSVVSLAVACPAAAGVGGSVLTLAFDADWSTSVWEWWVSGGVGEILFLPLWWKPLNQPAVARPSMNRRRVVEGALALSLLGLLSLAIFHFGMRPVVYLTVPFSIWLALRAGMSGVILGNLILSAIAVWNTAHGYGPLGSIEPIELRLLFVQIFSLVSAMSCLVLGAVVNERQRALSARIESDDRLRDLFDNISDLVTVMDLQGGLTFVNRAWQELMESGTGGASRLESLAEVVHPDDREMILHLLSALPEAGSFKDIEVRFVTREGATIDVEGNFSCRAANGSVDRIRAIFRDVTSRKVSAHRLEQAQERLEQANAQLRKLAATDALTGIANRRAFHERLEQEESEARRHGRPLSVVMLDVDFFKMYNDEHGHPAGDAVLQSMGEILTHSARTEDTPARTGGEEFAVILPMTDAAGACHVAERMRLAIEGYDWPLRRVTASFGVATIVGSECDGAKLMQAADEALYLAKKSGRNRVMRASTSFAFESIPADVSAV